MEEKKPTSLDIYKIYSDRLAALRQLMGVLLALTGALGGFALNVWLKSPPHAEVVILALLVIAALAFICAMIFWFSARRLIREFGASKALAMLRKWEAEWDQAFILPLDSLMTAAAFQADAARHEQKAGKADKRYFWDRWPLLFSILMMLTAAAAPGALVLALSAASTGVR